MIILQQNNEPDDLPQLLADELTFVVAKFKILYHMPNTKIARVLAELIGELLKPAEEQEDENLLPPNRN